MLGKFHASQADNLYNIFYNQYIINKFLNIFIFKRSFKWFKYENVNLNN